MFSSVLEYAKARLFQATDAYSRFEGTREVSKTFRQSKEETLYVMKRISPSSLVPGNISTQYDDENAA
jgi:hypothetical protein